MSGRGKQLKTTRAVCYDKAFGSIMKIYQATFVIC